MAIGGLAVLGPLVLSPFVELPYLVFAIPPMVLGLATWIFMLGLDRPKAPRRIPPEGTVVALRTRQLAGRSRAEPRAVVAPTRSALAGDSRATPPEATPRA